MISAALQAAQQKLLARRQSHVEAQQRAGASVPSTQPHQAKPSTSATIESLPAHLGWGSQRLHQIACKQTSPEQKPTPQIEITIIKDVPEPVPQTLTIYPNIAIATLRENQVPAARIWWILRMLDTAGRGQFSAETLRAQLTCKNSAQRICGWRQMRKLLTAGNDLFWRWDGSTVWLRSRIKVADALEITRFQMAGVEISAETLYQPIAKLKASLYATFHDGRKEAPIARATLTEITGISESSQRRYEKTAGIVAEKQIVLETYGDEKEAAWQYGYASFKFVDHRGLHGPKEQAYLARQLPNVFRAKSPLEKTSKQKVRRLNRCLTDLLKKGTVGNGWQEREQRYFMNGAELKGECGLYYSGYSKIWYSMTLEK